MKQDFRAHVTRSSSDVSASPEVTFEPTKMDVSCITDAESRSPLESESSMSSSSRNDEMESKRSSGVEVEMMEQEESLNKRSSDCVETEQKVYARKRAATFSCESQDYSTSLSYTPCSLSWFAAIVEEEVNAKALIRLGDSKSPRSPGLGQSEGDRDNCNSASTTSPDSSIHGADELLDTPYDEISLANHLLNLSSIPAHSCTRPRSSSMSLLEDSSHYRLDHECDTPDTGANEANDGAEENAADTCKYIGIYSPARRKLRIQKFIEKRKFRMWTKKVKYDVRKNFADSRVRIKGRFVKKGEEDSKEATVTHIRGGTRGNRNHQ